MTKYGCLSVCLLFACLSPLNAQQSSTDARHDEWSGQRGLESEIIALEHKYWEAWKNRDAKTLAQIRADDFREADQDGVLNKKQAEEGESDMEITSYVLKNEKVSSLEPDVALLSYEVAYRGSYKGKDISSPHAFVASMYVRRDDNWRLAYSQETAARNSEAAKEEEAQALSTQVLAKEKEILETLKHNDWPAFSDLLADDVVAIDEDGIVGKKELIDGIKTAGTVFTDYKMENVKVIPQGNGAIVAYRETLVGTQNGKPFTWHIYTHSHWERRGGKWLMAMFQDSMAKEQYSDSNEKPNEGTEQAATEAQIVALEKRLWNGDAADVAKLEADDYEAIKHAHRYHRADDETAAKEAKFSLVSMDDVRVRMLRPDVALLSYHATLRGSFRGTQMPPSLYFGSVWVKRGGEWKNVFLEENPPDAFTESYIPATSSE